MQRAAMQLRSPPSADTAGIYGRRGYEAAMCYRLREPQLRVHDPEANGKTVVTIIHGVYDSSTLKKPWSSPSRQQLCSEVLL